MKTMMSKKLIKKFGLIKSDTSLMGNLNSLINRIQDGEESILTKSKLVEDGIYVYKLDEYRIFFSIQKVNDDDVFVLLDFIHRDHLSQKIILKDPQSNHTINPVFNRNINPVFNRTINPVFNRNINPVFNRTINPVFNRTINPVFNRTINPVFNRTINPVFNRTINPVFNRNINPIFNPSFDGYYVYDTEMKQNEYIVKANDDILLFFNVDSTCTKYAVSNNQRGYVVFSYENNDWIEYMVSNENGGYLLFDTSNNWIGSIS